MDKVIEQALYSLDAMAEDAEEDGNADRAMLLRTCVKMLSAELERTKRALEEALKDAKRMDWLADPENTVGNVQLPTEAVTANLHSLRDAIDAAIEMSANAGGKRHE